MSPRAASWLVVAVVVALGAPPASATKFRKPYNGGAALGHGFDNNYGAAGCTDYACGGKCYNTHGGSDFPMVTGTEIVAAAGGTVTTVVQGCANTGYRGNPCGSYCGNYVKIAHADGHSTIYCHMKNGSIVVSQGQGVSCGQKIGQSASSGSSTGPHLHFGWKKGGSTNTDPYTGNCSGGGGAWVSQGPYNGAPGTGCEVTCQCNPGQQQSQGCGKCGTKTRTCNGSCQWGGWSGCQGQGPCTAGQSQSQACGNCGSQTRSCKANCQWTGWTGCNGQGDCSPGAVQDEPCCDCGARARTCGGDCSWAGWSDCDGPDPEPSVACLTGQLGVCEAGQVQCLSGCLACVDTTFPSDELCDGLDNDCDGPVDEDATELGPDGPPLGAEIVDLSAPAALRPGEEALVWVVARNVGTEPWPASEAWVAVVGDGADVSPFWDSETWEAHDIAVALDQTVPPGGEAMFAFRIRMPDLPSPEVTGRFEIAVRGEPVRCPAPEFEVMATRLAPAAIDDTGLVAGSAQHEVMDASPGGVDPASDAGQGAETAGPTLPAPVVTVGATDTSASLRGSGCAGSPRGGIAWWWFAVLALWLRSRGRDGFYEGGRDRCA